MKLRTKRFLGAIALFFVIGLGATTAYRVAMAKDADKQTIHAGVYLDGVYVGGLTKEEAMEEYDQYIDGIEDLEVTFTTVQGSYSTTLKDIGVEVSVEDAVDQAYNYGRQGNILSRYKEIKSLEEENVVLVPDKEFDKEALKEINKKIRPTNAGLNGLWPKPPKVILATPIATAAPMTIIHHGIFDGKLKANRTPVTTADRL